MEKIRTLVRPTIPHYSIEDRAYLAGFVDGEGCITLMKTFNSPNRTLSITPRVIVVNTNPLVLMMLKEYFGGSVGSVEKSVWGRKEKFQWYISGYGCILFLESIFDYLKIKKEQAKSVLSLKSRYTNPKKRNENGTFPSLTKEEKEKNILVVSEIGKLNGGMC